MEPDDPLGDCPPRREGDSEAVPTGCWWLAETKEEMSARKLLLCKQMYNQKTLRRIKHGVCSYGSACLYAHSFGELEKPGAYNLLEGRPHSLPADTFFQDWGSGHELTPYLRISSGKLYPTMYTRAVEARNGIPKNRTSPRICYNWLFTSKCTYWSNCQFLHVEPKELKATFSRFYCRPPGSTPDQCPYRKCKTPCPYAHDPASLIVDDSLIQAEDPKSIEVGYIMVGSKLIEVPKKYWTSLDWGPLPPQLCQWRWCDYCSEGACEGLHLIRSAWSDIPELQNVKIHAYWKMPPPNYGVSRSWKTPTQVTPEDTCRIVLASNFPCLQEETKSSNPSGKVNASEKTNVSEKANANGKTNAGGKASLSEKAKVSPGGKTTPSERTNEKANPSEKANVSGKMVDEKTNACEKAKMSQKAKVSEKAKTSEKTKASGKTTTSEQMSASETEANEKKMNGKIDANEKTKTSENEEAVEDGFLFMFDFRNKKGEIQQPLTFKEKTLEKMNDADIQTAIETYGDGLSPRWSNLYKTWIASGQRTTHGNTNYWSHASLEVAKGFSAKVLLGLESSSGREVAVKCYFRTDATEQKSAINEHFHREVKALIHHESVPGVVKYYNHFSREKLDEDTGETLMYHFIFMELMEGTLEDVANIWLQDERLNSSAHIRACKYIMASVIRILDDLNNEGNLVHRDIKPQNILVDRRKAIRLIDFGVSRVMEKLTQTAKTSSTHVGTITYASPEAWSQNQAHRTSDIFSLGLVLCYLINPKFGRPTLAQIPQLCSGWPTYERVTCGHFLTLMLQDKPNDRAFHGIAVRVKLTAHEILLAHPFLWTQSKALQFLVTLGNLKETIVGLSLAVAKSYRQDWFLEKVDSKLQQPEPFAVDSTTRQTGLGLLRFIRNMHLHCRDPKFAPAAAEFLQKKPFYFLEQFPSLVTDCWTSLVINLEFSKNHILLKPFVCESSDIRSV